MDTVPSTPGHGNRAVSRPRVGGVLPQRARIVWLCSTLALLAGCTTPGSLRTPAALDVSSSVSRSPASEPPTSVVLLRLRQTLHGSPAAPRKALSTWVANIDRAEPMHRIDSDPLPADLAAQGWIAWRLPTGTYQLVIAGYRTNGLPPRTMLDRYRFRVNTSERALYLGSISYACEPAWWFEALCPAPAAFTDDMAAAVPLASRLGLTGVSQAGFEPVPPAVRLPQLEPSQTLVMAGDGASSRSVHDFLTQARGERVVPVAVGAQLMIGLAPLGPFAVVVAVPATVLTGVGIAIHGEHLKDKAQCLQRVWDERVDAAAHRSLDTALQRLVADDARSAAGRETRTVSLADARQHYRHLLALDVQRLTVRSCHPSQPWLPDPRAKRFCLEAAIRARVYAADAAQPLSDEIFSLEPSHRVGHEFELSGWPVPPEYLYETPLPSRLTIARTYDEYCDADGFARVESDLRRLMDAMVSGVLTLHGIGR
jgi:hypothetical protein